MPIRSMYTYSHIASSLFTVKFHCHRGHHDIYAVNIQSTIFMIHHKNHKIESASDAMSLDRRSPTASNNSGNTTRR